LDDLDDAAAVIAAMLLVKDTPTPDQRPSCLPVLFPPRERTRLCHAQVIAYAQDHAGAIWLLRHAYLAGAHGHRRLWLNVDMARHMWLPRHLPP
jgi:hypothetical protein